jgi:hypothetical protein
MTATTTTPVTTRPSTSSLASSTRFRTFAVTFAIVGPVLYLICLFWNLPLFTYHPATNRFAWGFEAAISGEGPNMTWYGWTATTLLVGSILSVIATLLPERVTRKIPLMLVWLFPLLAIPFIAYSLMSFWTHP